MQLGSLEGLTNSSELILSGGLFSLDIVLLDLIIGGSKESQNSNHFVSWTTLRSDSDCTVFADKRLEDCSSPGDVLCPQLLIPASKMVISSTVIVLGRNCRSRFLGRTLSARESLSALISLVDLKRCLLLSLSESLIWKWESRKRCCCFWVKTVALINLRRPKQSAFTKYRCIKSQISHK